MNQKRYTVSDINVDIGIKYNHLLSLTIITKQGEHGRLSLTLEVMEEAAQSEVISCKGTEVVVSLKSGARLFAGICSDVVLSSMGGYKCVHVDAYTASIMMDKERKKTIFQDPAKTLQGILEHVCKPYNVLLTLDNDPVISQIEYQQNETDWVFIKRLAASQGKAIFIDTTQSGTVIYCGEKGFRRYDESCLEEECGVSRDVGEFARAAATGESVSGYMYDSKEYNSALPYIVAGDTVGDMYCVRETRVSLEKGNLSNRISLGYIDSIRPTVAESTQPAFTSGIIMGTVLNVSGNEVQVKYDSDSGMGGTAWIPYESAISNSFYCMPDIGDKVYVYQQNDGNAICMGSRHVNTDRPDFSKPEENVLTNHDKMIKMGETSLTITSTRESFENGDGEDLTIKMDAEEGISINSNKDIYLETTEYLFMGCRVQEHEGQLYSRGQRWLRERVGIGEAKYERESLELEGWDLYSSVLKESFGQFGNTLVSQFGGMLDSMTFGIFTPELENTAVGSDDSFEKGVITLYGFNKLNLEVGSSRIEMDTDIRIAADHFYWLGYEVQEHSKQEKAYTSWWETALDGLQLVLDIAGCIPMFGAIPDLINAGISLARGDFAGAAMSALSAIPLIGDAAGAVKIGAKAAKAVVKLSKAEKIMMTVQLLYQGAQLIYTVYQNRDAFASVFKKMVTLDFHFSNLEDVNNLITVLNTAPSIIGMAKDFKTLKSGERPAKPGEGDSTEGNNTALENDVCITDPVNVVTGSLLLDYDDLQLRDIRETFLLKRIYESVHQNKGMLLGSKWFLNIESKVARTGEEVQVQLPDMHVLNFHRSEDGRWENKKGGDRSKQLFDIDTGYCLKECKSKKEYLYDHNGHLTAIRDRYGNTIRFLYEEGLLYRMELSGGQYLDFTLKNGKLDTLRDNTGRTIHYSYDEELLTAVTLPNGGQISYEYTAEGYLRRITDQNGNCYVTNEYDYRGRVVKQTTADGGEYVMFYDMASRCNTFTDLHTGETTRYEYGRQNVPTITTFADGTTSEIRYDERENRIYERDRNGAETFRSFDMEGNLLEERTPDGLITVNEYDANGNRIRQYDNAGREVRWDYDEEGRLTGEHLLVEKDTWSDMYFTWDERGRLLSETNPNGNVIRHSYDGSTGLNISEPAVTVYPEGETIRYTYDGAGRMTERRDALGMVQYSYNRTDAITEITDREGGITRFSYDALGNRLGIVRPEQYETGEGIRFEYDCLDHLVRVTTPEGGIHAYSRGSDDRLLKTVHPCAYDAMVGDGEGISFDYDETGRCIRTHFPDGGCERYFLDGNGNIIKKVLPNAYDAAKDDGAGYVYAYDPAGRLLSIRDPYGRQVQTYTYDLAGNLIKAADAKALEEAEESGLPVAETLYTYNLTGWMTEKREPLERREDGSVLYALTTYAYDKMGNLLMEKRYLEPQEAEGMSGATHTIRYEYDRSNRPVRVSDCSGAALEYVYGKHGLTERERVRVGENAWQETKYLYTPEGRIRKLAKELGEGKYAITEFAYDLNGNLTLIKLPEGGEISYTYDKEDRLIREEHQGGEIRNILTYAYDAAGNLISTTDSEGHTERKAYDLLDREILHTAKDGGIHATRYDLNGNPVMEVSPLQYLAGGAGYIYSYDLCDRLTGMKGPEGQLLAENSYDRAGNLTKRLDGAGSCISVSYDLAGRRRRAVTAGGSSQSWCYDATGNVNAVTDGLGNRTEFVLDRWGRITGISKADGSHESYTYDYAGNMLTSTDGEGHTVRMEYDVLGQMIKRTDPAGRVELFAYDREGRLTRSTDRNGTTTCLSYNLYGSLTSRTAITQDQRGKVTESFGYYPDGKLKYAIGDGMRYDYTYDCMGRLTAKRASGKTLLSYTYDLNGNRTSMTDVTGKCTGYRYNSLDLLEEVTDNERVLARYQYNGDGAIRRLEVGNSLITEYGYDVDKNLISQKTMLFGMEEGSNLLGKLTGLRPTTPRAADKSKSTVLVDNTYAYDNNANRTEKRTLTGLTRFVYDNVNRLVKAEYPSGTAEYRYDKADNRTAKVWKGVNAVSGMQEHYHYDSCNRLTDKETLQGDMSRPRQTQYHYDLQGNLLSDGSRRFTYDAMNRLAEVRNEDGSFQKNRYDCEGLRTELEENGRLVSFIFDGDKAVTEEEDQNTIRYIRGYDLISSDSEKARTYYHYACDEMGSITHVIDEEGTVLNRYEYDAFGDCIYKEETVANRFGFAGEQYDPAAGMYYLRARFYNPAIGRFIQEDTYYGDGLNLYAYCHNNPVGYVDPSGHICQNKYEAIEYLKKKDGLTSKEALERYREYSKSEPELSAEDLKNKITGDVGTKKYTSFSPETYYSYRELRKLIKSMGLSGNGIGFEAHHLLEKQYAKKFGVKKGDIISVALTPMWHRGVNGEKIIGVGTNINWKIENELMRIVGVDNKRIANRIATPEQIWQAHKKVYENMGHDDWASAVYEAYVKKLGIDY